MNVLSYDKVSKAIMDSEMHTKVFGLLLLLRNEKSSEVIKNHWKV